ncbi:thermonuclease family protein [Halodesulfurarchaeum formicicum]|uniref:thermonuclease family protein n=1 Tax=Halodesulfurarchaeum formicicum TaxID=1873524 RepID=UPI0008790EB0|nr:thermonuclease family protein [Halodesulfurarchaeum formicicum]
MRRHIGGVLLLVVLAGCAGLPMDPGTGTASQPVNVTVTEVVDGDTIDVRFADGRTDRVRLLGVDTPEVHVENDPAEFEGVPDTAAGERCLRAAGENATTFVESRVADSTVRLEFDPLSDRRGGYDRLLAYVYLNETNLNYQLVETGHARVYDSEFTMRGEFYAAERDAQAATRGVWNCTTHAAS